ncbi:MAG: hypothetical protein M0P08_01700 [Acholeplasmataceae bacterium]|nr:hypothetical protein [Acholeplasmataceae bacterium]
MGLIKSIINKKEIFLTNEKIEWELHLNNKFQELVINPFNTKEFKIEGYFRFPSKAIKKVYAFYFKSNNLAMNFQKEEKQLRKQDEYYQKEIIKDFANEMFLIRFLTKETGEYHLNLKVTFKNKVIEEQQLVFNVKENKTSQSKGVLKVEQRHKRNFIFENGETFIPVGQNNAWYTSSTRKLDDYRVWFSKMRENNANFTRIWLNTRSFALHSGEKFDNFISRMNNVNELDQVIELAIKNNLYFMLTLLQHGQFSAKVNPAWKHNKWNKENGGILSSPEEFFTNPRAKEIYQQQLIYLVARYGHLENLAAWELWNEVDWTDNFNSFNVVEWHDEMTKFIKEIDIYGHLVTTSYKHLKGEGFYLKSIDYANPHSYDYTNLNINSELVKVIEELHGLYKKPILHSEIGIDWRTGKGTYQKDPEGITIKQNHWGAILGGGAGGGMNWWWDSFVHFGDLYFQFKGIGKFVKKMNMVSEKYQLLQTLKTVKVSSSQIKLIGYLLDDRSYGYLYHKDFKYNNKVNEIKNVLVEIPFNNGNCLIEIYNTTTGEVEETLKMEVLNEKVSFKVNILSDKAFIAIQL